MPRTGRGGKVDGKVGQAYSNRTDLNAATTTVPGQEYGQQIAQQMAMRNVPTAQAANNTLRAPQTIQNAQPAPSATSATPAPQAPLLWDHPSDRPGEPIHAGLPVGPGPGPEALAPPPAAAQAPTASLLAQLASAPGATPEVRQLALAAARMGM